MKKPSLITREEIVVQTHGGPTIQVSTLSAQVAGDENHALIEIGYESILLNHGDIDSLVKALTAAKLLNEIHYS